MSCYYCFNGEVNSHRQGNDMGLYLGLQRIGNLGETFTPREIQSVNGRTSVQGNIEIFGTDIKVLSSLNITVSQRFNQLSTDISSISSNVYLISSDISSLPSTISCLSSNISSLSISLSALSNDLSGLSSSVSTISIDVIAISGEISALPSQLSSFANSESIASLFNPSKEYDIDEVVMYNSNLYRCISATTSGLVPTLSNYWEKRSATDNDIALLRDDQGHLVIKDVVTNNDEYVDAYRFNDTSVILDASFNDLGVISSGQSFSLPPALDGHARDFALIMTLSGATLPSFTFPIVSSDLEPWSEQIPEWKLSTTYRITFTETRPSKWEIHVSLNGPMQSLYEISRKVQSLSAKVNQLESLVGTANQMLENALGGNV